MPCMLRGDDIGNTLNDSVNAGPRAFRGTPIAIS